MALLARMGLWRFELSKVSEFGWALRDALLCCPRNQHPWAPLCRGLPKWQLVPRLVGRAGSPLAAHVEQEDVEAGVALLHALQHLLHTQAVGRGVGAGRIDGHHEAVAKVFITMPGIVEQTWQERWRAADIP